MSPDSVVSGVPVVEVLSAEKVFANGFRGLAPVSLTVRPGDLLQGDRHGVLNVPLDLAARIPEGARAVDTLERQIINYSQSSEFTVEGLAALFDRLCL